MWRQNEEFDSLMSGFTSNLKCMQLKSQKWFVFESQNTVKLIITLGQSLRQFS